MDTLVSVVLPVHNQADHIAELVEDVEVAFERVKYRREILLVLNACRDESLVVCTKLAERYPSVRIIDSEKGGWGFAVRLGLSEAKGDILCYSNSARTSSADLVLLVLYAIANPTSVVKATRRIRESIVRRIGSFLYNLEGRILFDLPTWDINSTPKTFSRGVYESITLTSDGDLIDLEFYAECKRIEAHVVEVPIYSMLRHGGKSTTNFRSAFRMYWGAFQLYRARKGHVSPTG